MLCHGSHRDILCLYMMLVSTMSVYDDALCQLCRVGMKKAWYTQTLLWWAWASPTLVGLHATYVKRQHSLTAEVQFMSSVWSLAHAFVAVLAYTNPAVTPCVFFFLMGNRGNVEVYKGCMHTLVHPLVFWWNSVRTRGVELWLGGREPMSLPIWNPDVYVHMRLTIGHNCSVQWSVVHNAWV